MWIEVLALCTMGPRSALEQAYNNSVVFDSAATQYLEIDSMSGTFLFFGNGGKRPALLRGLAALVTIQMMMTAPEPKWSADRAQGQLSLSFWRKRMRVERTDDIRDAVRRFLKITRWVLIGYENSLLYLILCPLSRNAVLMGSDRV
jgi:hypothetical protein